MIDQEFDSTLNEAEISDNLTPRKRSRRDPRPEPRSAIDVSKGKGIDEAPVDVHVLQERVFFLEQQLIDQVLLSVTKDMLISELQENQVAQNLKIQTLEANMGYLTTLFMDLKQQLNRDDETGGVRTRRDDGDNDEGGLSGGYLNKQQDSEVEKRDGCAGEKRSDKSKESKKIQGEAGPSQQEEGRLMFDTDDLLEDNVELTETEDPSKRKWVAGRRVDTSERLIIPSVCHKDYFKKQQDLPEKYDKVGDRSSIHSWHYDGDKQMWVVKRKRGNLEYYEGPLDFESWTRVDLAEFDEAPFFNRSNYPRGTEFYDILHEEAIDLESSEAVINCGDHEYRISDKNDLLRFGEHDIKILAMHQIKTDPVFEVHGKDITSLAASNVRTKLWAGSNVRQTLPT
ncbi:hypothetical protein R6Q59_013557 [Mikania micrantha]